MSLCSSSTFCLKWNDEWTVVERITMLQSIDRLRTMHPLLFMQEVCDLAYYQTHSAALKRSLRCFSQERVEDKLLFHGHDVEKQFFTAIERIVDVDNEYCQRHQISMCSMTQKELTQHKQWIRQITNTEFIFLELLKKSKALEIEAEKQRQVDEEVERKKKEFEAQVKLEQLAKHNKELADQREWISKNWNYYHRCKLYSARGYDGEIEEDQERKQDEDLMNRNLSTMNMRSLQQLRESMENVIVSAHEQHNDLLLAGKVFPGCHDFGLCCGSCDQVNCTWTYGDHRCSCDNYKGFGFNTENVDWLEIGMLDSQEPSGRQERGW